MKDKERTLIWIIVLCTIAMVLTAVISANAGYNIVVDKSKCEEVIEVFCRCNINGRSVSCEERDEYLNQPLGHAKLGSTSKSCNSKLVGYRCSEVFIK